MFARLKRFTYSNDDSKSVDEEDPESDFIRVVGTNVYFTGEVCQESIRDLNVALMKTQMRLMMTCASVGIDPPGINLFINSTGGCVFSGFSGMDHIRTMKLPVTTIVDGCCCSAATFLLLGGHKRLMKENSFVLIHQITNTFWGKFEELKDEMETTSRLMEHIMNVYRKETKISEKRLKKFMKRDVYMNSDECIRYGVVSGVFEGPLSLALKSLPENEDEDGDDD